MSLINMRKNKISIMIKAQNHLRKKIYKRIGKKEEKKQ